MVYHVDGKDPTLPSTPCVINKHIDAEGARRYRRRAGRTWAASRCRKRQEIRR